MRRIQDRYIELGELKNLVARYVRAERSVSTRRNYEADWNMLRAWCQSSGREFPPCGETITLYFAYLLSCGHKVSSVNRRLSSFRYYFRQQGLPVPDLSVAAALLAGARRELRQRPKKAGAFSTAQLSQMCAALGRRPIDIRDRTILVLGFASGLRASEMAALDMDDVAFHDAGIVITIRRSKTDQEGKGRMIGVFRGEGELCPVEALADWLEIRGAHPGPLIWGCSRSRLRPGRRISWEVVHKAVRRAAAAIGLDPLRYGAHSLRASFVTAAAARGAHPIAIMQVTGHKNVATVAGYIRPDVFAFKTARAL